MAATYRPRRSSARWTEGAPEYVLACYDNGGKTADRYTVLFGGSITSDRLLEQRKVFALFLSEHPSHPQGVSMWDECQAWDRSVHGKHVRWLDLPEQVRKHVMARAAE